MRTKTLNTIGLAASLLLAACAAPTLERTSETDRQSPNPAADTTPMTGLAPIRTFMDCLPKGAAVVAAHRGTGAGVGAPENSVSGLEALIEAGVMMAEIDIARIRDGTLISFHDGVWDDKASGRGPVVSTRRADFDAMRLRLTEKGTIGGESVPTLDAMLETAKDRIYLELDTKTSADIARVIDAVRAENMEDQVILIASTAEEGQQLAGYADEFVLSLGYQQRLPRQGVWVGGRWRDDAQDNLAARHYRLGSMWTKEPGRMKDARNRLEVIATDQVLRFEPVEGLKNKSSFDACLAKGR